MDCYLVCVTACSNMPATSINSIQDMLANKTFINQEWELILANKQIHPKLHQSQTEMYNYPSNSSFWFQFHVLTRASTPLIKPTSEVVTITKLFKINLSKPLNSINPSMFVGFQDDHFMLRVCDLACSSIDALWKWPSWVYPPPTTLRLNGTGTGPPPISLRSGFSLFPHSACFLRNLLICAKQRTTCREGFLKKHSSLPEVMKLSSESVILGQMNNHGIFKTLTLALWDVGILCNISRIAVARIVQLT